MTLKIQYKTNNDTTPFLDVIEIMEYTEIYVIQLHSNLRHIRHSEINIKKIDVIRMEIIP